MFYHIYNSIFEFININIMNIEKINCVKKSKYLIKQNIQITIIF